MISLGALFQCLLSVCGIAFVFEWARHRFDEIERRHRREIEHLLDLLSETRAISLPLRTEGDRPAPDPLPEAIVVQR